MTKPTSLIPGPLARVKRQRKIHLLLPFVYQTHVVTSKIVARLLGTTASNSSNLCSALVKQGLLREMTVPQLELCPRGRVLMLTPEGVRQALKRFEDEPHDYDARPESIKVNQLSHELHVATVAAAWVAGGGRLLRTDYQARHEQRTYIQDLLLEHQGRRLAVEIERTPKRAHELSQKLQLAMDHGPRRILVLCGQQYISNRIDEALRTPDFQAYARDKANKWAPSEVLVMPLRRRLAIHTTLDDTWNLDRPAAEWLAELDRAFLRKAKRVLDGLREQGWDWKAPRQSDARGGCPPVPLTFENGDHGLWSYILEVDPEVGWIVGDGDGNMAACRHVRWRPGNAVPSEAEVLEVVELTAYQLERGDFLVG